MRRNFLLLFLMTLLPLAGWAAEVDISTVAVEVVLNNSQLSYTAAPTQPGIVEVTVDGVTYDTEEWSTYFDLEFYKKTAPSTYTTIAATEVKNAGNYAVALVGKGQNDATNGKTYTSGKVSSKTDFTINKATLNVTYGDATKVYGAADPVAIPFTINSGVVSPDDGNSIVITFETLTRDNGATKENVKATHQYTSIVATSTNYEITTSAALPELTITGAPLTVTYNSGNNIEKVYGDRNPALVPANITVTGWVNGDGDSEEAKAKALKGTLTYTQTEMHANYNAAGEAVIGGLALYDCEFSGLSADNYIITWPTNKMMIKQRTLVATPSPLSPGTAYFTYTNNDAETTFTYDGTVHKPSVAIKFMNADGDEVSIAAADFTVAYAGGDCIAAKDYTATVNAVANGNLNGSLAVAAFDYSISKAKAWVYFKDQSKVYKAADYDLSAIGADFEFNGVIASDIDTPEKLATLKVGISASYASGVAGTHKDVKDGGYAILPVVADGAAITANYDVTPLSSGKLTITQRPIKITATTINRTYDGGLPAAGDFAATAEVKDDEAGRGLAGSETIAALEDAFEVKLKEDNTKDYTAVGNYAGAVIVEVVDASLAPNYAITPVPGDLEVSGASLSLIAKNQNITYGQAAPTLEYIADGYDGELNVTFTVKKADETIEYVAGTTILDHGTYTIEINELADADKPVGYQTFTYVPGTLTVAQKVLTIHAGDVTVNEGASVSDLNVLGKGQISFTDAGDNKVNGIDFKLAFNTEGEGCVAVVTTEGPTKGNLSSSANTYNAGYKVVVGDEEDDNYKITWGATGKLIVGAEAVLQLDRKALNLVDQLTVANGKTYTVSFTNDITLTAKKWNCMVLPFAISVGKLSAAMKAAGDPEGYAIVDMLSSKSTGINDIRFELYMGTIPANTPFLVKTATNVKWNEIQFPSVTITAPTEDEQVGATATDVEFVGVFKAKKGLASDEIWYLNDLKYYDSPNATINAFSAFLRTPGQEGEDARIFIEDIDDNGTTVIKELNLVDMTATTVKGWYTLNGVKLNAAPTQKGIYINNGKKVIIK